MKILKKLLVSIIITASIAASSAVYAAATGEAKVTEAAEKSIAKIEEAVGLVEKGGDKAAIVKAINEARQIQKEFRYELTERQREKANNKLKAAREAFEKDEVQPAEAKLREALADFQTMKATYDANHK
ncbi:MAG: hypothetical protein PHY16_13975 [Methylobacter sp.]|nr:hypothetical protein [Methylobacter sp.]